MKSKRYSKRSARVLPADLCTDHAHYVKNYSSTVLRKKKHGSRRRDCFSLLYFGNSQIYGKRKPAVIFSQTSTRVIRGGRGIGPQQSCPLTFKFVPKGLNWKATSFGSSQKISWWFSHNSKILSFLFTCNIKFLRWKYVILRQSHVIVQNRRK